MPISPATFRFGDFSFDPASGELEGADGIARLQPQVAALLHVLIGHAGAVVTRAELQARLWPDTTVEFDDGLNFCIRQLRLALGDDANSPTYIETLPRRGYRFLTTVITASPGAMPSATPEAAGTPMAAVDPAPRPRRRWALIALLAVLVVATFVLWRQDRLPGQRTVTSRTVLLVLPFATDTTDPMMATYRQRLFDQIGRDAGAEAAWDLAKSQASGVTHVLSGSLTRDGNSVKLFVQLATADRHKLWADDIVDLYAFSGNSMMTADRIEKAVARILRDSIR